MIKYETTQMAVKDLEKYHSALDKVSFSIRSDFIIRSHLDANTIYFSSVGPPEVPQYQDRGDQQDHSRLVESNLQGRRYHGHSDSVKPRIRIAGYQIIQLSRRHDQGIDGNGHARPMFCGATRIGQHRHSSGACRDVLFEFWVYCIGRTHGEPGL